MFLYKILYLLTSSILSIWGIKAYIHLAEKWAILAIPKDRSLHRAPTPKGGGIVIAGLFLVGLLSLLLMDSLPLSLFLALFGGGVTLVTLGFIDDLREVDPRIRFLVQILVSFWALYWLGGMPKIIVGPWILQPSWILLSFGSLGIVWFINLFNFMDGVDGMLASNSILFSLIGASILFWLDYESPAIILVLLVASLSGFLVYNWPPAKIFMGDSGAGFIGYVLAVIGLYSVAEGMMDFWTWIILMGYFVADTTTTMFIKIATVPDWFYEEHKSHAYQQLASIWKSHKRVTIMVLGATTFWMAPIAFLSIFYRESATILAIIALSPVIFLTLRWGPLYRP